MTGDVVSDTTDDSLSKVMSALSASPRREVLFRLYEESSSSIESPDVVELNSQSFDCSRVALYHQHLPNLAEKKYIEWDQSTFEIQKGENFDEVRPLLQLLDEHDYLVADEE